jgi:polysaccharide chain length determinant protein (PEP-CTERM system associated)
MKFEMPQITPELIIDIVIRRRWVVMLPLSIALLAGIFLAVVLPKTYEATTLILVEGQSVPQNFVRSIVTEDPASRINTISQQILSRTNLEKIITEFNLFTGPDNANMYMEDKLESLRKKIDVQVTRGRGGADAFSVSFQGRDPKKVMAVANNLATSFIDANLKVREAQSIGTSDFLESELEASRLRLEQVEENIKNYRKANMGELPEQLQTNLTILGRLQENLLERRQSLQNSRIRLAELNNQTSNREPSVVVISGGQQPQESGVTLESLQAQLEALQARYTEKHPDIQRLKKQIADFETKSASETTDGNAAQAVSARISPQLRQQISEIQREIKLAETEIVDIEAQIRQYQSRVENTPKREQELLGLRRDYENIQTSYDSLLSRKLEADVAVNMERKQKGEQFRIVDPAREPQKPISPNMKKLFLVVIALGLGVGGVLIFLLEFAKPAYRKPEEMETQYDIPVLIAIPELLDSRHILMKKINMVASIGYLVLLVGLIGMAGLISVKGSEAVMFLF